MVESSCIEANRDYAKESSTMTQWNALFFLHQMLLDKHHKLFSALQQQPENLRLQQIPNVLGMPARLWHSIKDFWILLCSQHPFSPICMEFHDLAYRAVSTLLEIATALKAFREERSITCEANMIDRLPTYF